jgi:hypothetical protein
MATFRLGLSLFIVIAVIFLIRGVVLPRIAIWTVWAAVMAVVPLLFRWLGVGLGTYLITQAIYLRPSSSILANQGAGAFAPELTGIVLGVVVLVLLMPLSLSGPNRPTGIGQLKFGRLLKRGALVFVIVALAHATPASAMMSYCADSYCCFFNNRNAILAVAALLFLAALFFLPEILAAEGVEALELDEASAVNTLRRIILLNGAERTFPLGFESETQFLEASDELYSALEESGISDASIGVRGSSITGFSFRTSAPFGAESDVDFYVESQELTAPFSTSSNIPGFVHPDKILTNFPSLEQWTDKWTSILGRDVTPGGFTPGSVPNQPAIRVF